MTYGSDGNTTTSEGDGWWWPIDVSVCSNACKPNLEVIASAVKIFIVFINNLWANFKDILV